MPNIHLFIEKRRAPRLNYPGYRIHPPAVISGEIFETPAGGVLYIKKILVRPMPERPWEFTATELDLPDFVIVSHQAGPPRMLLHNTALPSRIPIEEYAKAHQELDRLIQEFAIRLASPRNYFNWGQH